MSDPIILTGTVSTDDGTITADVEIYQVSAPPTPAKLPDLIVTNVRVVEPAGPYTTGDPLLMAATVENNGERIGPGTIIGVAFYFGDPLACWTWSDSYTDGLDTGATVELTANGGFNGATFPACGPTLRIEARVDDTSDVSRILESNEANNRLAITIDVAAVTPPDPPVPPDPGTNADAKLTLGVYPGGGPGAPEYLTNFYIGLAAAPNPPPAAQNLGGSTIDEFLSTAWAIGSSDPAWGQDWLRQGQPIALTVPIAFPPAGVAYGNLTDAQRRQALFDTANGVNDWAFRQAAAYMASIPDPGTLIDSRVGHEPDATWYCWSIAGGIDAYHAAQHHVIPLWKELIPTTPIVFNMNGALDRNLAWSSVPWGTGQAQTELIFTALADYCDIVAADIYYSANDPGFIDVTHKVDYLLAWSNAWQKPACVPEWGLDSVDWPDAIDHWRAQMERFAHGQLLYHCYFDAWSNASLSTKPNAKQRFYSTAGFAP